MIVIWGPERSAILIFFQLVLIRALKTNCRWLGSYFLIAITKQIRNTFGPGLIAVILICYSPHPFNDFCAGGKTLQPV